MNPLALKVAIEKSTQDAGLPVPIVAAITGDDLLARQHDLRSSFKKFSMSDEEEELWPEDQLLMSCNAYQQGVHFNGIKEDEFQRSR